jgi:pimeloyl-ACP methyl ester carboxylesterase
MQTVTSADGTTIAYDKAGTGPAVILVAGAFSYRKFPMLPKLVEELAASKPLPPADLQQRLSELIAADRRSDAVKYMMTKGMGASGFAVGIMRLLPLWKRLTVVAHTLPYDVAILGDKVNGEPLSHGDWADVKAPTLVIAGGKAPELVRTAARQLAEVLPDGQYHVLEGQSHNVSPKALAPVLTEFFQR